MHNELYHFGIKGMKWGVRRARSTPQTLTTSGKKRNAKKESAENDFHDDYKKAHSNVHVSRLSDSELRSRLNRLQMEQQYDKLSTNSVKRGRNRVEQIMKTTSSLAAFTGAALTLHANANKIKGIVDKMIDD